MYTPITNKRNDVPPFRNLKNDVLPYIKKGSIRPIISGHVSMMASRHGRVNHHTVIILSFPTEMTDKFVPRGAF